MVGRVIEAHRLHVETTEDGDVHETEIGCVVRWNIASAGDNKAEMEGQTYLDAYD